MSDRRLTTLVALTVVALLAVVGAGSTLGASAAAADLAPRVTVALTAAGLEDVQITMRGREATVRGGTLDELAQAVQVAEQVPDVRSATIDDRPGSVDRLDTTRPYLRLRRDPGRLRILGAVPTAAAAATVKSSAARAFGVPVRGDLVIDPSLPSAPWTGELPGAFGDLVGVAGMQLTIDGDTLELDGSTDTAAERADIIRLVSDAVRSLTVESDVAIAREGS